MDEKNTYIALEYFAQNETRGAVDNDGLFNELNPRLEDGVVYQNVLTDFVEKRWIEDPLSEGWFITDIGKAAYERRKLFREQEQDRDELHVEVIKLNKQLIERQIAELDCKDATIAQQRQDLIDATNRTTQATWKGAILGAVITIAPTIWLAYMKPDTVVLPPTLLVHDTTIKKQTDTVYLPDSLLEQR